MSIAIKGMDMPTSCSRCPCSNDASRFCRVVEEYIPMLGKPAFCPLVDVPDTNVGDMIYRKAAIDRINKQREHLQPDIYPQDIIGDAAYRICAEFIERLPSAQPVIRCKDCKYHGYNECFHKLGLMTAFDNNFCSYAERKEQDDG